MHMERFNFEQGPIRPPSEADSLLIRTTRGCPWNRCAFCTLYKKDPFSIRSVEEIKQDIFAAQKYYNGRPFETCFLQDGDSFVMQTKDLLEVLKTLKQAFPKLKQISSYGRARTMVKKSTKALNQIDPKEIRVLSLGVKPGTDLAEMAADGSFTMLSEVEMIQEQKRLLSLLDGVSSRYRNYHAVNLLVELDGKLPEDKTKILSVIDQFLSLSSADQLNFILGRRLGHYHRLEDLRKSAAYKIIQKEVTKIQQTDPTSFETVFHDLRKRLI